MPRRQMVRRRRQMAAIGAALILAQAWACLPSGGGGGGGGGGLGSGGNASGSGGNSSGSGGNSSGSGGNSSGSGGNSSGSGGSGTTSYPGKHTCQTLLSAYKSSQNATYSCPPSLDAGSSTFTPPKQTSTPCTRDIYVNEAIVSCWAAECYAQLRVTQAMVDAGVAPETPAQAAARAQQALSSADSLCSEGGISVGGVQCSTLAIWGCP